jgi:hypothetical protein
MRGLLAWDTRIARTPVGSLHNSGTAAGGVLQAFRTPGKTECLLLNRLKESSGLEKREDIHPAAYGPRGSLQLPPTYTPAEIA